MHVQTIYVTVEPAIGDLSVLGRRGEELCRGIPVVWILPVNTDLQDDIQPSVNNTCE